MFNTYTQSPSATERAYEQAPAVAQTPQALIAGVFAITYASPEGEAVQDHSGSGSHGLGIYRDLPGGEGPRAHWHVDHKAGAFDGALVREMAAQTDTSYSTAVDSVAPDQGSASYHLSSR